MYWVTDLDVVILKEERGSRGWVDILARQSLYQDTTLLMLAKRPRSNKIVQQCLVLSLNKRCLMLSKASEASLGGRKKARSASHNELGGFGGVSPPL